MLACESVYAKKRLVMRQAIDEVAHLQQMKHTRDTSYRFLCLGSTDLDACVLCG